MRRCPNRLIRNRDRLVCAAAEIFGAGMPPFAGLGWMELPAPLLDAIGLVEREHQAIRREGTVGGEEGGEDP